MKGLLLTSFCCLALLVAGSPVQDTGSSPRARGVVMKLKRRSMRQGSPVDNDDARIFDPSFAQSEIKGMLAKYAHAEPFLQGIGLNPDSEVDPGDNYSPILSDSSVIPEASDSSRYGADATSLAGPVSPSGTPVSPSSPSSSLGAPPLLVAPFQAPDSLQSPAIALSTDETPPDAAPPAANDPDGAPSNNPHTPGALLPSVSMGSGTGILPLRDYYTGTLDLLYYGGVKIGTPAQTLSIDVDTGSADLWVPVACTNCDGHHQFAPARSTTYRTANQGFMVTYGSGAVSGRLATDVVTMAGLTVQSQTFGAVGDESDAFSGKPNDGLIGLAFGTIATSRAPTFFENLMQARAVAAPMFSIHLARNRASGSEICFGCFDSAKTTGGITWVPVQSKTYWSVRMTALDVNNRAVNTNIYAAIDTGTTLIYLPSIIASQFYALIPGAKQANQYGQGFYTYPCNAALAVALSFSGHRFAINMFDFNLGRTASGSTLCVGGILALGGGFPANLAIVGDEFLKSWYSTYDYSNGARVGFSPDINNQQ